MGAPGLISSDSASNSELWMLRLGTNCCINRGAHLPPLPCAILCHTEGLLHKRSESHSSTRGSLPNWVTTTLDSEAIQHLSATFLQPSCSHSKPFHSAKRKDTTSHTSHLTRTPFSSDLQNLNVATKENPVPSFPVPEISWRCVFPGLLYH